MTIARPHRVILGMILAAAALALAGCGFKPMYATGAASPSSPAVTEALRDVQISPIADRDGTKLRQTLRERLEPAGISNHPRYTLDVQLRSRTEDLGLRRDATASHANVYYTARISLSEGGQRIFSDTVQAIVSYNILDDQYATVAAIGNAGDRAITEVGEEIKTRLAVFLERRMRQANAH